MPLVTVKDVQDAVREIYHPEGITQRVMLLGRPLICPFHTLIQFVPPESSVLDIGCGSGMFLNVLKSMRRIRFGIGFDASEKAIKVATSAWNGIKSEVDGGFRHVAVEGNFPEGEFDVVSMVDVMHHIDPAQQKNAFAIAVSRVAAGGRFIYKDIGHRPIWRALANRLHDLLLARQWINYVPTERIVEWAGQYGMHIEHRATINMFWYGHELLVLSKPAIHENGTH